MCGRGASSAQLFIGRSKAQPDAELYFLQERSTLWDLRLTLSGDRCRRIAGACIPGKVLGKGSPIV